MSVASEKALLTARQVAETLGIRLSSLAITSGFDTSGNPTVALGAGTAGSQSAFIRIKQDYDPSVFTDPILGVASQRAYTPHVVQLVVETSTISNVALLTEANKLSVLGTLLKLGMKVELYMTANTTAPSVSGIASGNLVKVWDHLYHPMTSTM